VLKIAENGEKSSHLASLRSAAQLISDFRGETRGIGWDLAPETVGWDGMGSHLAKKWWDGMGWDWVLVGSHGMGWDGIEFSVPSSNSAQHPAQHGSGQGVPGVFLGSSCCTSFSPPPAWTT